MGGGKLLSGELKDETLEMLGDSCLWIVKIVTSSKRENLRRDQRDDKPEAEM